MTNWPKDTIDKTYLAYTNNIADILDRIKAKWPNASLDQVEITAEHIHTNHLGYDLYDSTDYTDFLVISFCEEEA